MPLGNCPDRQTLSAFAMGNLADAVSESVVLHIETCPVCQSALATLEDGNDTLIAQLRSPGAQVAYLDEAGCQEAVARLKAMPDKPLPMDNHSIGGTTTWSAETPSPKGGPARR